MGEEEMVKKTVIQCKYLIDDNLCSAVNKTNEARHVREESCTNEIKNYCCYMCVKRQSCEISCAFLDQPQVEQETLRQDSTAMLWATKIVSDPNIVEEIKTKYQIICDQALVGLKFDNLNKAINVMAEKGWRCIGITSFNAAGQAIFSQAFYIYALMEKL